MAKSVVWLSTEWHQGCPRVNSRITRIRFSMIWISTSELSKSLGDSDWIWGSGLSISYRELSPGFHTAHRPIIADTIDHVDQMMHLLLPASIPLVPPHFFINSTTFCMNILRMKYNVFTIYDKTTIQKKRPTLRTQSVNDVGRYYEKFHQHWAQYICAQRGICCLTYWHSSVVLAFVVQAFVVLVFICRVGVHLSCGHSLTE